MAEGIKKMAWGKTSNNVEEQQQPIVSFVEIMEEQEKNEEEELLGQFDFDNSLNDDCSRDYFLALELSRDPDCSADELLAAKLQREYDRELELSQKFEESRAATGRATALLSSETYSSRYIKEQNELQEESSDEEYEEEFKEFATKLLYEKSPESTTFPPCGFLQKDDGTYITKHDQALDERKGSKKAMQLPLGLETGDVIDHRIGRRILNDLRSFAKLDEKRNLRFKDKEEKETNELSMDVQTRLILLKWINSSEIDRVEGIIATGKESAVLHAVSDCCSMSQESGQPSKENLDIPSTDASGQIHYAIKVYRTTLTGFKNRAEYVKNDFRFKNPRSVMKVWAEKEFMNMKRLRRANIKCPTPIKLKKHVLLMSMIGSSIPAPKLREIEWETEQMKMDAFAQVRQILIRMYKECNLVHGDLSEFNLLYHSGIVYVIDLAQAMDLSHPSSLRFLHRDLMNILSFFGRIGCENLPSPHLLFNEITDIEFDFNEDLFVQVETFERENRNLDIREGRKHTAEYELKGHRRESSGNSNSPSREYN
uniref:Serine/threonine-protein kinase RIO3 n=1 Tax=Meloidogyne hapla TaxID=6305 RepID=A0A1I8BQS6_MELHA